MPKLAVHGPLGESHLHHDFGTHPMNAQPRKTGAFREWRSLRLETIEPFAQVEQHRRVEAGAELAGKDEVAALEVADQQCAEADPCALGIREAADDKLLRRLHLHLQPVLRSTMLVRRAAPLGDHALPSLAP